MNSPPGTGVLGRFWHNFKGADSVSAHPTILAQVMAEARLWPSRLGFYWFRCEL
jgi:hypothetical protein